MTTTVPSIFSAALSGLEPLPQSAGAMQRAARSVGVVLTGDSHLSAALPRLSPQRRAERRERLRQAFATAAEYAIQHGALLFAQLGDLFDTPTPANDDRAFVARTLASLHHAGVTCVAIGGNHDTPRMSTEHGGQPPQSVYAALGRLLYFPRADTLQPHLLTLDGLRLAVAGLTNNPTAAPGSDPLADVPVADPDGVLAQADTGLLLLHAGIEGLCRPTEGERIVARATLDALPPVFRIVAAGHIHRFARDHLGERTLIVSGATERMTFGEPAGGAGFVWLELTAEGVQHVEHIPVIAQPRADLTISTARLWPGLGRVNDAATMPAETLADVAGPAAEDRSGGDGAPAADSGSLWPRHEPVAPDALLRRLVAPVCTPETLVRVRLAGPLTLDQYHQLSLRDVLLYGQQHAFSFDLDTSGLLFLDPTPSAGHARHAGPVSPVQELEALLEERLAVTSNPDPEWAADQRAAAELVLGRLRQARESEASR